MKKLIALLMIISFVTVTAGSAFAAPGDNARNRAAGRRVERRHENRGPAVHRPGPNHRPDHRPNHRPGINRQGPNHRPNRQGPVMRRPDNRNSLYSWRSGPSYRGNFFNRAGRYPRPYYRSRPIYRSHYPRYHRHHGSSLSGLEIFGIGASLLLLAAMINSAANDY
ncbi:MAG: hypothetical protein FWG09_04435 [Synergistaceae bacterium]|nr:hypothetical protein [Synergistaceae bacterium]